MDVQLILEKDRRHVAGASAVSQKVSATTARGSISEKKKNCRTRSGLVQFHWHGYCPLDFLSHFSGKHSS